MTNNVCIGMITAGNVHMATVQSLLGCVTTKAVKWIFLKQAGPYLDDARNTVVSTFCDDNFADCTHLLMVDSDIEFTPDHVAQLVEDDLPVVSGVYHNLYDGVVKPVVYEWSPTATGKTMTPINEWTDEGPLVTVDGCGAGFLMLSREAIATVGNAYPKPQPWFAEDTYHGTHFGEDLCFNVRCAEQGIATVVDRRVQLAHHKSVRLSG
jgi:hypothetical protein